MTNALNKSFHSVKVCVITELIFCYYIYNLNIWWYKCERFHINMQYFMQFAIKLIRIRFRSTCTLVGYLIVRRYKSLLFQFIIHLNIWIVLLYMNHIIWSMVYEWKLIDSLACVCPANVVTRIVKREDEIISWKCVLF